jgi:DNA polymerase III subunit epsilon
MKNGQARGARQYIAIDFETATSRPESACAIGLAFVVDGAVVEQKSTLIRPKLLSFNPINTRIHGIKAEDVEDSPEFDLIWKELKPWIEGQVLVAHNAPFDTRVLRAMLQDYQLPYPEVRHYCTCQIARRVWPFLPNHKLSTVSKHLNLKLRHHDASSDANACAHIAIAACKHYGTLDIVEMALQTNTRPCA